MPEGPSIVILKESVQEFIGKKVGSATGNSKKVDIGRFTGQTILDFKSWGKHFLICFPEFTIRIHLMLFGSYRINEHKDTAPRLSLCFDDGTELNFYGCSVQLIEEPLDKVYDWSGDVMNDNWDEDQALSKLQKHPDMLVCDALLDQHIFSGVGNIIKNEVLFRIKVHPLSLAGKLPLPKLKEMIREAVIYSFEFLVWKKEFTLKKHWKAHTKKTCPRDHVSFQKAYLGKTKRRSFFCTICQELYV
jgi:endonuclease-8